MQHQVKVYQEYKGRPVAVIRPLQGKVFQRTFYRIAYINTFILTHHQINDDAR